MPTLIPEEPVIPRPDPRVTAEEGTGWQGIQWEKGGLPLRSKFTVAKRRRSSSSTAACNGANRAKGEKKHALNV